MKDFKLFKKGLKGPSRIMKCPPHQVIVTNQMKRYHRLMELQHACHAVCWLHSVVNIYLFSSCQDSFKLVNFHYEYVEFLCWSWITCICFAIYLYFIHICIDWNQLKGLTAGQCSPWLQNFFKLQFRAAGGWGCNCNISQCSDPAKSIFSW